MGRLHELLSLTFIINVLVFVSDLSLPIETGVCKHGEANLRVCFHMPMLELTLISRLFATLFFICVLNTSSQQKGWDRSRF